MAGRNTNAGPLIIGGAGGSGTRVYKALAEQAGYRMLTVPGLLRLWQHDWHDHSLLSKCCYSRWPRSILGSGISRHGFKTCAPIPKRKSAESWNFWAPAIETGFARRSM